MSHLNFRNLLVVSLSIFCHFQAWSVNAPVHPNAAAPPDFDGMWRGFDPRSDPMETEILKQWEEGSVVMKIIRYRIGKFKGQKSIMAGVYGYPKGQIGLPGLLQVHGGGQYAHSNAVLTNAKRGYATLSIAWAGRISAPEYTVSPNEVQLFWKGKKDNPEYKLTTDWGALDAYHAPSRYGRDAFASLPVADWTLDPVKSPRNSSWFLVAMAGRRGLTFLEQQPEVDGSKLGVYGHSMGGKLTVMIAGADRRVKAAVPSCGGISDRYSEDDMHLATVSDPPSLEKITAPTMFLSPSNDFHGRINDLETAVNEIKSKEWRVSCSPHHNHQDTAEFEVGTQLWFDQHLSNAFEMPRTPEAYLSLKEGNLPVLSVTVDPGKEIENVAIYFTQQGVMQEKGAKDNSNNTKHRFWKFVQPSLNLKQNQWIAEIPIFSIKRPLWVYANVRYRLEKAIEGAGYYYGTYKTEHFTLSSLLQTASSADLEKIGVLYDSQKDSTIENFRGSWRKDWFTYNPQKWGIRTNKLYEPKWSAKTPASRLSLEVKSTQPNPLIVWLDGYGTEINLVGNNLWQRFNLPREIFKNSDGASLQKWSMVRELRLDHSDKLGINPGSKTKPVQVGGNWEGAPPEFRNLKWID